MTGWATRSVAHPVILRLILKYWYRLFLLVIEYG
jgi:hypothetical protein